MRFGFVGLGRAARLYHLRAVRTIEGAEPIGGFDAEAQQLASWREQTRLPSFDSLDDLVARGAPDVVVATPPGSHAYVCGRARVVTRVPGRPRASSSSG